MSTIHPNHSTCPNDPWSDIGWNKTMCDARDGYDWWIKDEVNGLHFDDTNGAPESSRI